MIEFSLYFIFILARLFFLILVATTLLACLFSQLFNLTNIGKKHKIKIKEIFKMSIIPTCIIFVWCLILALGQILYKNFN